MSSLLQNLVIHLAKNIPFEYNFTGEQYEFFEPNVESKNSNWIYRDAGFSGANSSLWSLRHVRI